MTTHPFRKLLISMIMASLSLSLSSPRSLFSTVSPQCVLSLVGLAMQKHTGELHTMAGEAETTGLCPGTNSTVLGVQLVWGSPLQLTNAGLAVGQLGLVT
ncbi:hypothetical protein BC827DRAFT_1189359 [Russula dissimulans]|nr:hypothetical protein BC827DRAFT_1189359 [Russula dissimulans]